MSKTENQQQPFWEAKSLAEMSEDEWESLCDGCGRCCLQKLQCADSGEVFYTQLVCSLYDMENNACSDYNNRHQRVPQCVKLTQDRVHEFGWLPNSCSYRLLAEGKKLPDWHPLVCNSRQQVISAGLSIRGKVLPEQVVDPDDWEEHIIHWVE